MSGTELDENGFDTYHPARPWEQVGHPLYLCPDKRTASNWPPDVVRERGINPDVMRHRKPEDEVVVFTPTIEQMWPIYLAGRQARSPQAGLTEGEIRAEFDRAIAGKQN